MGVSQELYNDARYCVNNFSARSEDHIPGCDINTAFMSYVRAGILLAEALGEGDPAIGSLRANFYWQEKTDNRNGVFRDMYHSPDRFHLLPEWVTAYCNFRKSAFVNMGLVNEEDAVHEFLHCIIPSAICVPANYIEDNWPSWLNEGFVVYTIQRGVIKIDPKEIKDRDISIPGIRKRGIFPFDDRRPNQNSAYQYCALFAEALGSEIAGRSNSSVVSDLNNDNMPPMFYIARATDISCHDPKYGSLDKVIEELGISLVNLENNLRRDFKLEPLIDVGNDDYWHL